MSGQMSCQAHARELWKGSPKVKYLPRYLGNRKVGMCKVQKPSNHAMYTYRCKVWVDTCSDLVPPGSSTRLPYQKETAHLFFGYVPGARLQSPTVSEKCR